MIPTLIFSILFAICFAFRNHWQQTERDSVLSNVALRDHANRRWHQWQFALQILVGLQLSVMYFFEPQWQDGLLFGAVFWITFELVLNHLNEQPLFYVGGGGIDKFFNQFKNAIPLMIAAKVSYLSLSIFLYNL